MILLMICTGFGLMVGIIATRRFYIRKLDFNQKFLNRSLELNEKYYKSGIKMIQDEEETHEVFRRNFMSNRDKYQDRHNEQQNIDNEQYEDMVANIVKRIANNKGGQ